MIQYQVKSFAAIYVEMQPLIREHWLEVALDQNRFPLKIDWDFYFACEKAGTLLSVTAREEGDLVGYCLCFVKEHPRYRVPVAVTDVYYLIPSPGLGLAARYRDLFRFTEAAAQRRGAQKFTAQLKVHRSALRGLFERMGYVHIEDVYAKTLEA